MQRILSDRVVLGGTSGPLEVVPAALTVRDQYIVGIRRGSRSELEALPVEPDVEVVDVGSRMVTPAFVNAHTHLPMSAFRGLVNPAALRGNVVEQLFFQLEKHVTAQDVRAFALVGAYESLLAGVGCVWEHYYYGPALAEAFAQAGLSAVVAPTLQDLDGPGVDMLEEQVGATLDLAGDAKMAEAGVVAALGPHATDTVSSELWSRVRDLADTHELPIHVHVAQSVQEFERSLEVHGCSPIGRLHREGTLGVGPSVFLVHGLFVSHQDIALLDPARQLLVYCPFAQLQFGYPAHVDAWRRAGVPVAVGTDCGACNDRMDVQQELRLLAGGSAFATTFGASMERFMREGSRQTAQEVWKDRCRRFDAFSVFMESDALLRTTWSVPGGRHPKLPLGELREGGWANLLIWDLDHPVFWPAEDPLRTLCLSSVAGALWGMVVSGRWVGQRGNFHRSLLDSPAYTQAHTEATRRARELLERCGLA
ncbi:MAG: amidohydrolase family protein [Myxococcota bacterium]|nr:amidohydrolase family protein [Myxococcota bacterium]